jgi:uncharacterized protein CXXCG
MKKKFWHPYHSDNYDKHAEWADEMDEETWELVVCPANKGHQRGGKRLMDLSVVLPGKDVEDFVWTWYGDFLIQDHVLSFLKEQRFTGFEVKPVRARFKKKSVEPPPKLWELVVTGWGGMAPPESGIEMTYHCEACGLTRYSGLSNPDNLIDERRWDGSDFFIVWPLPGFIFVTDRVANAIKDKGFSGVVFTASIDLRPTDGLGAGRLSYYMPEQRAREIGEPLGIY